MPEEMIEQTPQTEDLPETVPEETTEVPETPEIPEISEETPPSEEEEQDDGEEAPEEARREDLWRRPDFPRTGWKCTGITDMGQERIVCQLCGRQLIRYVHHMEHPQFGKLSVGCICAGKMEGDIEGAKRREREFKKHRGQEVPSVPYHDRYYLQYCGGKRCSPMDLEGTKAFLHTMGFDGGELRQAREGKDRAESLRNADEGKGNKLYCSYCGAPIAGVEFYRLPDGRVRCTTCSSTVVQTKAEVQELLRRVLSNMENFFGATLEVPVTIEVLESRKLKRKLGVPLGTKDDQGMLLLGVAINNKGKYSILLENGAPRISLAATFAHELTHIWQYTHWDDRKNFKKCAKAKKLLIYEGMAKWVQIQYLYLIGETAVAKREEYFTRNRQDEYGIGFCLYEDRYPLTRETMACEETPFTPDRYPLD